jgi:hypothetical protein
MQAIAVARATFQAEQAEMAREQATMQFKVVKKAQCFEKL